MKTRKVRLSSRRSLNEHPTIRGSTIPVLRSQDEEYQDMWAGRALNEVKADRPRAERAVRCLYDACGLPAPDTFMWVKSPLAALKVELAFLEERENPMATKSWKTVQQVRSHLNAKDAGPYWFDFLGLRFNDLLSRIDEERGKSYSYHVGPGWLCDNLSAAMGPIYRLVATRLVSESKKRCITTPLGQIDSEATKLFNQQMRPPTPLGGQFYVTSTARLLSPSRAHLKQEQPVINAFADLVSAASIWLPFRGFCVMTERPTKIALDEQIRLHNLKGPAIEWPDGFGVYAVAGIPVDSVLIDFPELLNTDRIEDEDNAEVRRALISLYGEERFMKDSGATIVSYGRDEAKLWSRSFASDDDGPFQMVEVKNSTPEPDGTYKTYFLRVPPTVKSADEAVAWTFDLPAETYSPEKET